MTNTINKLKRAVIKEELVALTGDFRKAVVLNQMIYWSERRKDADKFLNEEIERINKYALLEGEKDKTIALDPLQSHGWIYKKAEELSEETMINVKPKAMREYLKYLVANGWLQERRNPNIKMDRTLQYRVDLLKIQTDLNAIGHTLDGYSLPKVEKENTNFPKGKMHNGAKVEKENTKGEKENTKGEKEKAIPKTTNIDYKTNTTSFKDDEDDIYNNKQNETFDINLEKPKKAAQVTKSEKAQEQEILNVLVKNFYAPLKEWLLSYDVKSSFVINGVFKYLAREEFYVPLELPSREAIEKTIDYIESGGKYYNLGSLIATNIIQYHDGAFSQSELASQRAKAQQLLKEQSQHAPTFYNWLDEREDEPKDEDIFAKAYDRMLENSRK